MTELVWFDDESMLRDLLLTELDEPARVLYTEVHQLEFGCLLLQFFGANERTLLTAEDVAFHPNRPKATLEDDLHALAELGLIRQIEVAGVISSATWRTQAKVNRSASCWQARLARITHLIGGGPPKAKAVVNLQIRDNDSDLGLAA